MEPIVAEGLEQLREALLIRFPRETRKAMRFACADAARLARSEGNAIARKSYTAKSKKKVDARITSRNGQSVLRFTGGVGDALRRFDLRPKKPGSRPPEGVSVRVKKGGSYRPARGEDGQKTFLFRAQNGALLLGYRKNGKVSSKGLVAASPIQAVAKRENAERIAEHAGEKGRFELLRQLGRVLKGEIK